MGAFNKFMLCMAFFLVTDQDGIGNNSLIDVFGHDEHLRKLPINQPSEESMFSMLKEVYGKCSEKVGYFKLEDLVSFSNIR
jgi:hypothetical protein